MKEKLLSLNPEEGVIRFSRKVMAIFMVLIAVSVSSMFYVLFQGSIWLYNKYQGWNPEPLSHISIPNIFKRDSAESNDTVRVVSEDSQIINVVKNASPAVVSIIASAEVPRYEQCFQKNDGFGFFDMPIPSLCQQGTETRRVGAGSGFLVSADGYILTNRHVVADENAEYAVFLNDEANFGKRLNAKVMARDSENDIAILKIEATNLPYLHFGDSSKLRVGQTAIAIGYALGEFDNTVSKGVVSGLSRSISAQSGFGRTEELRGLIQTDAAINPGNSGGPLLDIDGSVIGMNVAMADAQSIGFAVPSNVVKNAYTQVRQTGKITTAERSFLGVRYAPISQELAKRDNLPYDYGMLIATDSENEPGVVANSPAARAGLKSGDIILEVSGKQLNERYILSDALSGFKPGDTVSLKVYSSGAVRDVEVKLDKRP